MQLPNAPAATKVPTIANILNNQRLARYAAVAGAGDQAIWFKFYMWNCALCEAFYFPLQVAEIAARNAVHGALVFWLSDKWYENNTLLGLLDPKFRSELAGCITDERTQHGAAMTTHHVCSALSFGFWEHLTTKRFDRIIWKRGIRSNFPNSPAEPNAREKLHDLIESVRRWRNRIAHHKAIFDKAPSKKLQDTLLLIRWICDDTADWVTGENRVQTVINARPDETCAPASPS